MVDESSRELISRYMAGDERAAEEIFVRYVQRLTGLARSRLSNKLTRRVDPEDVVQSAYRSFFLGARNGRYEVREGLKLWSLLAKITIRKVYRQAERQGAAKTNVDLEASIDGLDGVPLECVADEPTPEEANEVAEVLDQVMDELTQRQRQMLEMHLQGHDVPNIAMTTQRSTKTVRRLLERVESGLRQRFTTV